MSESGRKNLHDMVKEAVIPDSTKSTATQMKEATTDTTDRAAREVQPDHSKSLTQETADKIERAKDNTEHGSTHQTIGDKVKHAFHMDKTTTTTTDKAVPSGNSSV